VLPTVNVPPFTKTEAGELEFEPGFDALIWMLDADVTKPPFSIINWLNGIVLVAVRPT
jgi:hypothetical protein